MKTQIALATLLLFATSLTQAESVGSLRIDIGNLAQGIGVEIRSRDLALEKLVAIRDQLGGILEATRTVLPDPPAPVRARESDEACLDFAFDNYEKTYTADTAMNEAMEACRQITELEAAKYIFEKAYVSLTGAGAMDVAARYANRDLRGKTEILELAYEAYARSLSSGAAIAAAAENAAAVEADAIACLRYSYSRRSRIVSSAAAMNAAFEDCR